MTNEEKANEYFKNLDDCRAKELMIDAYLDGLAEGRKEKCLEQNKDGTIRPCELLKDFEKEKCELLEIIQGKDEVIEQLKEQIAELKSHCKAVDDVNAKMKNFYNCKYSSHALCPNEHKCKGCEDWELAE